MPKEVVDPIIAAADAAAEEAVKNRSTEFSREIDSARESALDDAFAEASKKTGPAEGELGFENGGVRPPVEGTPKDEDCPPGAAEADAVEKAEKDKADADKAEADRVAAEKAGTPPARKSLLDDLAGTQPGQQTPPADPYDIKLRSDASPKTRETFEQLKTLAKQREEAAKTEATAAKQSLEELQTKVAELEKRTVPDEVQGELKELRAFRAQFDTANDPEFRKKYDTRVDQNYESIYNKLKYHQLPDAELAKLKAYSPDKRDAAIEKFLELLPQGDKKFIEAKLFDNVNVADERDRALQEARTKADELLAKRKGEPAQQIQQRDAAVANLLKPAVAKLDWLHKKDIPANAAPEDKKKLEAWNKSAENYVDSLRRAIVDDTPEVRAEAAIAVPLAFYFRSAYSEQKERADKLQAKLDSIGVASATSRTARSTASSGAALPAAPVNHASAEEALDALFEEATSGKKR